VIGLGLNLKSWIKFEKKTFLTSLSTCTQNIDLIIGARIHNDDLVKRGLLESAHRLWGIMHTECGKLGKAKELFNMYTTMLSHGFSKELPMPERGMAKML